MQHSGMFPSSAISYFNGYWAWDTWKQAVGSLVFDPGLAREQVREMFRHQDESGMIADVVYLNSAEDNWRDSKPPLAGWAIESIYLETGDRDFVRELYPKLVAYHEFWYRDRDHDRDGLCEYGSSDGTIVAARWESGMDNAVRFDNTQMLQNSPKAWSMNQESVDLNSYLYREKKALAVLAMGRRRHYVVAVRVRKVIAGVGSSRAGGKSELHRVGCRVTPGGGDPEESATERIPPRRIPRAAAR